jgi:hypothetical protein
MAPATSRNSIANNITIFFTAISRFGSVSMRQTERPECDRCHQNVARQRRGVFVIGLGEPPELWPRHLETDLQAMPGMPAKATDVLGLRETTLRVENKKQQH